MDWNDAPAWLAFGFLGNLAFFSRFLVQWIASERAKRSYIPMAFWYLSIAGSLILLIYAIHRRDPIFTLAYLPNCVVYVRNLVLIRREGAEGSPSVPPVSTAG
ncbi:MAG: lipid-A-disaccharide synthase N-terminal domain-containing protein [Myxococcota bacterium]|nr:lipid-A-disaccharide synthase N-terminal domain-containing protein [Myxococcota bacterium]